MPKIESGDPHPAWLWSDPGSIPAARVIFLLFQSQNTPLEARKTAGFDGLRLDFLQNQP